jgi:leucyl aminopeptidase
MVGDFAWPLPMGEEYKKLIKSDVADIANIQKGNGRLGGTIEGGMFLREFADGYTWAHIDMAPRMTASPEEHLSPGAVGAPVRLLVELLENWKK